MVFVFSKSVFSRCFFPVLCYVLLSLVTPHTHTPVYRRHIIIMTVISHCMVVLWVSYRLRPARSPATSAFSRLLFHSTSFTKSSSKAAACSRHLLQYTITTIFDPSSSMSLEVVDLCLRGSSPLIVSDDDVSSRVVQHPPPLHSVSTRHTLCDRRRSLHLRCERYAEDRNELNPPCCKAAVVTRTISRGQKPSSASHCID